MNIRFLETAQWLARLKSIKATAEKLCLTQAAVSSRISNLEQDLGVCLFVRGDDGFEPTSAGITFLEHAERIVDAHQSLRASMLDPSKLVGSLRIGMTSTLIPTILPGLVDTLRRDYPSISISLKTELTERLIKELEVGRVDLVLGADSEAVHERFEVVPLCTFSMTFVASPKLAMRFSEEAVLPEELAQHPIIGYPPGTRSQLRIDHYFQDCGVRPQIIHVSNAVPTNLQLATSDIGIAVVPEAIVQREIAAGELIPIKLKRPFVSVNYQAVFLRDQGQSLARAVAALARDVASDYCESAGEKIAWQ